MIFFVSFAIKIKLCCQCSRMSSEKPIFSHFWHICSVKNKKYKNASRPACNIDEVIQGGLIRSRAAPHQGPAGGSILAQMWPITAFTSRRKSYFQGGLSSGVRVWVWVAAGPSKWGIDEAKAPDSGPTGPLCSPEWGGNTITVQMTRQDDWQPDSGILHTHPQTAGFL